MPSPFLPDRFSDLSSDPEILTIAREIHQFINLPENIECMEQASRIRRPAVEGIIDQLDYEFGESVFLNEAAFDKRTRSRLKQLCGKVARDIMVNESKDIKLSINWEKDRPKVPVRPLRRSPPPPGKKIYLFSTGACFRPKVEGQGTSSA